MFINILTTSVNTNNEVPDEEKFSRLTKVELNHEATSYCRAPYHGELLLQINTHEIPIAWCTVLRRHRYLIIISLLAPKSRGSQDSPSGIWTFDYVNYITNCNGLQIVRLIITLISFKYHLNNTLYVVYCLSWNNFVSDISLTFYDRSLWFHNGHMDCCQGRSLWNNQVTCHPENNGLKC